MLKYNNNNNSPYKVITSNSLQNSKLNIITNKIKIQIYKNNKTN